MSVTVAHRPHIHLPYKSIVIFLVAAAVAAGVLVIVNQPWEEQSATTTTTTSATGTQAVAAPAPEPFSMLRVHPELRVMYGEPAAVATPERWSMLRAHPGLIPEAGTSAAKTAKTEVAPRQNLVIGTMLNGQGAYVSQPPARWYAPGEVDNARPLNFIAGSNR